MTIKFEARTGGFPGTEQEFDAEADARAFVEAAGSGQVITWVVRPNIPNRLPAQVYNSCALNVFRGGAWKGVDISR